MTNKPNDEKVIKNLDDAYWWARRLLREMMEKCVDDKENDFVGHLCWLASLEVENQQHKIDQAVKEYSEATLRKSIAKVTEEICKEELANLRKK